MRIRNPGSVKLAQKEGGVRNTKKAQGSLIKKRIGTRPAEGEWTTTWTEEQAEVVDSKPVLLQDRIRREGTLHGMTKLTFFSLPRKQRTQVYQQLIVITGSEIMHCVIRSCFSFCPTKPLLYCHYVRYLLPGTTTYRYHVPMCATVYAKF